MAGEVFVLGACLNRKGCKPAGMFNKRKVDKTNLRKRDDTDEQQQEQQKREDASVLQALHHAGSPLKEEREGESYDGGKVQQNSRPQASAAVGASTMSQKVERSGSSTVGHVQYASKKDAAPAVLAGNATHTSEIDSQTAVSSKATGIHGPVRAPAFVRTTTRMDYQPDVCKDYKETGFCGYGDSCKFLHDRGNYSSGWQQEKEWDEQQSKKKKRLEEALLLSTEGTEGLDGEEAKVEAIAEELPWACLICRKNFVNPVVTSCNHYFCSGCIIEHNKKSSKCPAPLCGKQMFGVFNKAHKLIKLL